MSRFQKSRWYLRKHSHLIFHSSRQYFATSNTGSAFMISKLLKIFLLVKNRDRLYIWSLFKPTVHVGPSTSRPLAFLVIHPWYQIQQIILTCIRRRTSLHHIRLFHCYGKEMSPNLRVIWWLKYLSFLHLQFLYHCRKHCSPTLKHVFSTKSIYWSLALLSLSLLEGGRGW